MGLVGVCGFGYLVGFTPALKLSAQTSMRTGDRLHVRRDPDVPVMGTFVSNSGMSRELFRAANGFVGHLRGGSALRQSQPAAASPRFCGSSVATAATFSAVAIRKLRASAIRILATGVIAAGGTLGRHAAAVRPCLRSTASSPSRDIGKLFIAGIIPGILAMTMYMNHHRADRLVPSELPADRRRPPGASAFPA